MRIFIDNLLVRGFYAFLTGNRSVFARDCFYHFVESLVIYDEINVTDVNNNVTDDLSNYFGDILKLADHEKELKLEDNWWVFRSDDEIPQCFKKLIAPNKKALNIVIKQLKYKVEELLEIEKMGFEDKKPFRIEELEEILLGNKYEWTYSNDIEAFVAYHYWFTFYCIQVAHKRDIPYIPNPSRYIIINSNHSLDFYYPGIRRKILEEVNEIRKELLKQLAGSGYLKVRKEKYEIPLIANYIISKTNDPFDSLKYAFELRFSKGARAFREFCKTFEESTDLQKQVEIMREIEDFKKLLLKDITGSKFKRNIIINKYGLKSIQLPGNIEKYNVKIELASDILSKFGMETGSDHLVFLHELVRQR